jgi:hypothetical protein
MTRCAGGRFGLRLRVGGAVEEVGVMAPFVFGGGGMLPFVCAMGEAVDSIEDVRNKLSLMTLLKNEMTSREFVMIFRFKFASDLRSEMVEFVDVNSISLSNGQKLNCH